MIHIEQNQVIPENENIFVTSPTGDYEDNALIEFCGLLDSTKILGAFAAQYIKYGSIVYKFNDPKELGQAILEIDPESTHGAASFVRMQNELLSKLNGGELEPESLQQVIKDEQNIMEEKIEENENIKTEEVIEEETGETLNEEEITTEDNTMVESLPEEGVKTEILEEEILPSVTEEAIKEEVVPIENKEISLPEEIISYAKKRKSAGLKIKRRI